MHNTQQWIWLKKILPLLAQGHSHGGPDTETPEGGDKPSGWEKKVWSPISSYGLNQLTKHKKKAPLELDLGSGCKQPVDKHCNLDQGLIKIQKEIQAHKGPLGSTSSQTTQEHVQSGHQYVNPTYVG
jgi:hypothetical protein